MRESPRKGLKTFASLCLIFGGLFAVLSLSRQAMILYSEAQYTESPQDVLITNISAASATVLWVTMQDVKGSVTLSLEGKQIATYHEEKVSTLHSVTLGNLIPRKTYTFAITIGGKRYQTTDYQFTTSANLSVGIPHRVFGQVLTNEGKPAQDVHILATIKDRDYAGSLGLSSVLFAQTNQEGFFSFDCKFARTRDGAAPFSYTLEKDQIELVAVSPTNERITLLLQLNQTQPIPVIRLESKNMIQDFTNAGTTKIDVTEK